MMAQNEISHGVGSCLADGAPVASVAPLSDFEKYWGFAPPSDEAPAWEAGPWTARHVPPVESFAWMKSDNDAPPVGRGTLYLIKKLVCSSESAVAGSTRPLLPRVGERTSISHKRKSVVHLRFQESASWLTPSGVVKKRKQLEAKGMPDFYGRRFITLTLDPMRFGNCPLTGYLAGKDHMRRFLEAGRIAGLWGRGCYWAWKLEFQRNGWAHWHLILDRTSKFNRSEMDKIRGIWGLGRTNVRRISKGAFGYHFKYAFKGVYQEDDDGSGLCVPRWFLDFQGVKVVDVRWKDADGVKHIVRDVDKPETFARVRFWQTSKGFYTGKPLPKQEKTDPDSSIVPKLVVEILEDRNRAVVVCARCTDGRYQSSKRLHLGVSYQYFIRKHLWDAEHGAGCTLGASSFVLDPHTITTLIDKTELWKLQPLLLQNRLTLKRALRLRQERQSLMTF